MRDGSTNARGLCQGGSPVNDDDHNGGNNNDNGGGAAEMPNKIGDKFEPPLKGTRQNLASWGSRRPPHWDQACLGVRGVRTPTTGWDNHHDPDWEKNKEGIEGGEDKHCNFKRVSYMAQIALPMPPRGQRRKGVD
jgi:hypothetical protein